MFRKVLVANRGEIAVRVMRACRELDVRTVAVYSDADRHAGHVRYADEAYNIGPPSAAESYLDGETIVEVAARADADAIHPGYGFLAENADFAARVEASPATWVGPPSDVMRQVGTKTGARRTMDAADVPIVPGTNEPIEDASAVKSFAETHGYPVAIKADAGGGGRGMVVIHSAEEIEDALERAAREGEAYFDDATIYVEKFIDQPKHVEVQILADQHGNVRHLGERDCSLQRRQQKVIEEAPAPGLDDDRREELCSAARRGLAEAGYTNAGTVEFLVTDDGFYFMEVNTRIQVEHPVSELVTGTDIVQWQLRVAAGEEIDFAQDAVEVDGHAIEFRINAEDPANDFAPRTGVLERYRRPGGIGVRVDDAVREGDEIGGEYDSMIAKLLVHAEDREQCLARSERALREFDIDGIETTIPFHRLMLTDPAFTAGTHHTRYLDDELDPDRLSAAVERWGTEVETPGGTAAVGERSFTVEVNGKRFEVAIETDEELAAGNPHAGHSPHGSGETSAQTAGTVGEHVTAGMQGTILSVAVEEGDTVQPGDVLCVIEAMKMENDVIASGSGTVTDVAVAPGDAVDMGDTLCRIE